MEPRAERRVVTRVTYFSTQNRISPFVALIGDWPTRAAMMQTCRAGTLLGWRKATLCEIELLESSPRHVALRWLTIREMLWTHKHPDLVGYYPGIVAMLRKHRRAIKANLAIVQKKVEAKAKQKGEEQRIAEINRLRRKPPEKQLSLF